MGNNQANEKPADKQKDEALNKAHINKQGKKEDTSDIYLEPEEDGTLQRTIQPSSSRNSHLLCQAPPV